MPLSAGTRLGPYEILAPIGAGGMGEVYRARDTKLDREVAIKVLPAALAQDPERLARFEREAKVLAALNHPNIAQIYGIEDRALVMELVPGESLKGPLPLETVLNYAKQIAEALEAAHDKGIVHRDLKPANIMVIPEGVVKVLDFGLAAMPASSAGDPSNPANSPTLTISPTRAGMILGTAAYMSPEQARGKPVDKRADIWAFGIVLYEMLTGKRLFEGETVSDTLAAVLKTEPDLTQIPPKVRRLLDACLQKDPKHRLQAIGDWRLVVEDTPPARNVRGSKLPWAAVAGVLVVALLVLGFLYFHRPPEVQRVLKVSVMPPEKAHFDPVSLPAVSPDGRRLAFTAGTAGKVSLWVRDLDSLFARELPGTDGAEDPFWSPDSRFIAFFALNASGGKLKRIDVAGGPALTLSDGDWWGGSWSKRDVIVFAPGQYSGLLRVPAGGGIARPVTELDPASGEASHRYPWFLPDGRHFVYTALNKDPEKTAVYIADLDSKTRHRVLAAKSNAVYSPPGYLLFLRERTLLAQPFDVGKGATTGDPVPIAEQVDTSSWGFADFQGQFSVSQNGILAYSSGIPFNVQLTWFDRSGKVGGTVGAPGNTEFATVSPDGNSVAMDRVDPQTGIRDIWLDDLKRGTESRFTFHSKSNAYPIWSPDGSHIAFSSTPGVVKDIYQKATSGATQDEVLEKSTQSKFTTDWSRDGRYIIYTVADPKTDFDIWVLPLFADRKPFPYLQTQFTEGAGKLSPNGQWLAYQSNETKRDEVYVQTFPTPGGKWQVSMNGGGSPVWSRDGKELYFIGADQKMMVVEAKGGAKFEASVPKALFDVHTVNGLNFVFDVSKDGRFLIPTPVEPSANVPMTVVVNWTAGLKK